MISFSFGARELRRLPLVLALLMLVAFLVLPTTPASAAVSVPGCEGTTATPGGAINTPGDFVLTGQQEVDYLAGKTVFLYDNKGKAIATADGGYDQSNARLVLCGVEQGTAGPVSQWRFCTDEARYGCANQPPSGVVENPKLSIEQESIIAYLLHTSDTSTKRSRAILQTQVWCISENFGAGTWQDDSQQYFNTYQFDNTAPDDPNSATMTVGEATCYDQAFRDAAVAAIPASPTMTLAAPTGDTLVDDQARFVLTTNFVGEIDLAKTGAVTLALCADDTSGATLAGNLLTIIEAGDVRLCAVRTSEGEVVLNAVGRALSRQSLGWIWNGVADCQVFSDFTGGLSEVANARAVAPFAEPRVSLGDLVWIDADKDGQFDQNEAPIQGVTVTLTDAAGNSVSDADGNPVTPVTTDENGRYSFTELLEGDYRVTFSLPSGYSWTVANTGNDGLDSDAVPANPTSPTATTATFTLTRDQVIDADKNEFVRNVTNPTIDAGVVLTTVPEVVTPKSKPVVTTVASSQQLLVGTKVHDAVIVKGLPAGVKTTAVARLYGPKASEGQLTCTGAAYASVTLTIDGNGTFNTPKVTVNKPGWYSWQVTLAEGPLTLTATEGCGQVAETMFATRPKPIVPTVPTGFVGIDPQLAARKSGPADAVKISALGVNAKMLVSGLRGKSMTIPKAVKQTAWYNQSAQFGDVIGSAVIAGHVSDKHDRPGAFYKLTTLKKGAIITVVRAGKTYKYEVTAKHKHLRSKPLPAAYFTNTGAAQLQLITCTSKKVFGNGRYHYTKNLVITAKLIG